MEERGGKPIPLHAVDCKHEVQVFVEGDAHLPWGLVIPPRPDGPNMAFWCPVCKEEKRLITKESGRRLMEAAGVPERDIRKALEEGP